MSIQPDGARVTLLAATANGGHDQVSLGIALVGAGQVTPRTSQRLPGVNNYFVGSSPANWRSGVSGFAQVTQRGVLPGVDIVYYGAQGGELEYDLVLAAGVDPNGLELKLDGAKSVGLNAQGDLIVSLQQGAQLVKRAPVAYQVVDGERRSVDVRYTLHEGHVGFHAGKLDARRPLVIDPVLSYATFLGAQNYDEILASTADKDGNTYVAGYTTGGLFPTVVPEQGVYAGGSSDAVVCKLNPAGNVYVYCTYLGGNNADQAYAVATDSAGNTYVTGVTYSTNFPTNFGVQTAPGGGGLADAFVTKLSPTGNAIIYSTYLGGNQDEFPGGIAVGPSGNAVVTGVTFSPNFPTQGALDATLNGADAFVTSYGPSGAVVYSTFLGGTGDEYANAVAVTSTGDAFVVGSTTSSNFPAVAAYQSTFGGGARDAFISRINASGSTLAYSSFLGGGFTDEAYGVAVATATSMPVVVGSTTSTNFPVVSAAQSSLASAGITDGFVTRFASATTLAASTYVGGTAADVAKSVALDGKGNCYVVGNTSSGDLPIKNGSAGQLVYHGAGDGFLAAYDTLGVEAYSGYLGGLQLDHVAGVSVSLNGLLHVAGATQSPDFPLASPFQSTFAGSQDGFIMRFPALSSASAAVPAASHAHALALAGAILGVFLLACLQRAVGERT